MNFDGQDVVVLNFLQFRDVHRLVIKVFHIVNRICLLDYLDQVSRLLFFFGYNLHLWLGVVGSFISHILCSEVA